MGITACQRWLDLVRRSAVRSLLARQLVCKGGQASVEFLALVPVLLTMALLLAQLALAGEVVWLSANAARVAARAQAVGRDPEAAARSALPRSLEQGLVVRALGERDADPSVQVLVRVPLLLDWNHSPFSVGSSAHLPRQS